MNDLTLLAELLAATGATDPAPLSEEIPSGLPWEADSLWEFRSAEASPALEKLTKRVEREELFTKIFGSFQVDVEPTFKSGQPASLRDVIVAGVESTIAGMDEDDLRKALAAAPTPDALQKRKEEFVAKSAETRKERLDSIICEFTKRLESKGVNTERLNFEPVQRSMNAFIEGVLMAA